MSYFDMLVWPGGGSIGLILWILSFGTLAVIIEQFLSIRRANLLPDAASGRIAGLLKQKQYKQAIEYAASQPDLLSSIIHAALIDAAHGYAAMERSLEEALEERITKLLRHIEWLNLIGNISPMLGLLGTVWGMINAFFKIVEVGGMPAPAELAGAIGVALVTTLLGLGVAIPALAVYAFMRNRIDAFSSEAIVTAQELIASVKLDSAGKGSA